MGNIFNNDFRNFLKAYNGPVNGVKAEATPNTEMIIISDVDLLSLKALHNHGSVQNLKDRRHDLYEVVLKQKKHDIKEDFKEALAVKI